MMRDIYLIFKCIYLNGPIENLIEPTTATTTNNMDYISNYAWGSMHEDTISFAVDKHLFI